MLVVPRSGLSPRALDRAVAATTAALAVAAALAIALSAPWPLRFGVLAVALLFGPAVPALRLVSEMRMSECLVLGVALDVALLMLAGEGLALAHLWAPVWGTVALLAATVVVSAALLVRSRRRRNRSMS